MPARSNRKPTSRHQLRSLAMWGGLMIGLGLLSMMRPGADRVRPVERTRPWAEPATQAVAPPPPAAPRGPRSAPRPVLDPEPEPEPTEAAPEGWVDFVVRVIDVRGQPIEQAWIYPVDCPELERPRRPRGVQQPGRHVLRGRPGPCELRVRARDGLLDVFGEPVTFELREGERGSFEITFDEPPRGGVGVQFSSTGDGMRVLKVMPGTPADRAGLEAGDLIVAVEGESVAGMPVEDFVQRLSGPVGTDVNFTLQYRTDTGLSEERLIVKRERLEG